MGAVAPMAPQHSASPLATNKDCISISCNRIVIVYSRIHSFISRARNIMLLDVEVPTLSSHYLLPGLVLNNGMIVKTHVRRPRTRNQLRSEESHGVQVCQGGWMGGSIRVKKY